MAESLSRLKVIHVVTELGTDSELVESLIKAEIIHIEYDPQGDALISSEDAERLRLVHVLTRELDVNLPGAEVILHMREDMLAMRQQFEAILDAVTQELRARKAR